MVEHFIAKLRAFWIKALWLQLLVYGALAFAGTVILIVSYGMFGL